MSSTGLPAGRTWLRRLLLLAAWSGLAVSVQAEPAPVASSPSQVPGIRVISGVSREFEAEVAAAVQSIPASVWRTVCDSGWRCELAEFVVDAAPNLRTEQPRGWPHGQTWEHVDAVHLPDARRLILAEKRRSPAGEVLVNGRVSGVLRHETGHAFDILGTPEERNVSRSARPEFRALYQADAGALSAADRATLAYYLQQRAAGPQETYAEAFAIALGGGSDVTQRETFARGFPRVLAHVCGELPLQARPAPPAVAAPAPRSVLDRTPARWRLLRR